MKDKNIDKFFEEFRKSLTKITFVKAVFGNYAGNETQLQKLNIRPIETKKGRRLNVTYRYKTRDEAKNYDVDEGLSMLESKLGTEFFSGHLFTTEADFQLSASKKGVFRLHSSKPTFVSGPELNHDRTKQRLIDPQSFYLKALGITNDAGAVKAGQQNKWKQINKFVETLGALFDESGLETKVPLKLVDMGCGKGYLTFAVYDYFRNIRNIDISVTGVDSNAGLTKLCSGIADSCGYSQLKFENDSISGFNMEGADILIALHACDTATDDALFKGITAGSSLIIASPCCHKEIRPQIKPPAVLADVLKHGSMLERHAELITDGMRSLLLESEGYSTKVFEFVPTEHTPKNNLITAVRINVPHSVEQRLKRFKDLKNEYGVESQRLEFLLFNRSKII